MNVDILMVSKIRLDNSFPVGQVLIDGYSPPIRLNGNIYGGGLVLFARENIPRRLLSLGNNVVEGFYVEMNSRKAKWLLCCCNNPNGSN